MEVVIVIEPMRTECNDEVTNTQGRGHLAGYCGYGIVAGEVVNSTEDSCE